MPLPFDGAISRYFREGAPKEVRKAIESAGSDILTEVLSLPEEIKGKDYDPGWRRCRSNWPRCRPG
jgi:hypothetical protein